jgi:uncharacterized membrane protein
MNATPAPDAAATAAHGMHTPTAAPDATLAAAPTTSDRSAARLDAFVDAAFAFAVTLLVVGVGSVPENLTELRAALLNVPAFAVSFALVAMFWAGHVRWRRHVGDRGGLTLLLSLALVFLVLVYVYPLRLMSVSVVQFVTGEAAGYARLEDVAALFTLYGLGFVAMSGVMAALWVIALRTMAEPGAPRASAYGEAVIWSLLLAAGLLSVTLAQFRATAPFSPWAYALLPVAIGVFVWRHDWSGAGSPASPIKARPAVALDTQDAPPHVP